MTEIIESHIKPLNDTIINYWDERGYDVTLPEHRLVGGLPLSIKRTTPRRGNAKRHGVVALDDLNLTKRANVQRAPLSAAEMVKRPTQTDKRIRNGQLPCAAFVILNEVATKHKVTALDLASSRRGPRKVAHARFELYYRMFNELMMTYTAVGRAVGGRGHETVLRGIERHFETSGIVVPGRKVRCRGLIKFLHPKNKFIEAIIVEVAEKYDITPEDIKGRSRYRYHAWPRQECYYRMSTELSMSSTNIGLAIGGRDHATILHGIKEHKKRLWEAKNALKGFL